MPTFPPERPPEWGIRQERTSYVYIAVMWILVILASCIAIRGALWLTGAWK